MPDATRLRVTAVQLPPFEEPSRTYEDGLIGAVQEAMELGADLVVLPELASSAYVPVADPAEVADRAQTLDGELVRRAGELTRRHGSNLLLPLFLAHPDGTRRNSVVALGPTGAVLEQRDGSGHRHLAANKLHLPVSQELGFDEQAHFVPGQHLGVWQLAPATVGALICYDRRFPEVWRELRRLGAQICAVPVAGPGGDTSSFFIGELRTHCRENGVVAIAANKVGTERALGTRIEHHGDSIIVDPFGEVLAHRPAAQGPGLVTADLDLGSIAEARRRFPYFEGRRTDLFGG